MKQPDHIISFPRQHGAMEFSNAPTDLDEVRLYRLNRVKQELAKHDLAGIILYDQLNTRYATDATNMQIWCSHNESRSVFVATDGPTIVYEYNAYEHLSEGLPTVTEVRPAIPWFYFGAGQRQYEKVEVWADEIAELVTLHGGGNKRIAVDRMGHLGVHALEKRGIELHEGFEIMEQARKVKSSGEIILMKKSIEVCELALEKMKQALHPGITENQLLAKLHEVNIAHGGEWIETRLLASGERTNPWFRESSQRVIERGDMVSFDTDLVGVYGYCTDISRSWICGDRPNDEQRRLYAAAVEQIEFNKQLLAPGVSFRTLAESAWPIPEIYRKNRYGVSFHGVGLCDEYPAIMHIYDFDAKGYDGMLEPGMVMCVESYIGAENGHEGVKLEDQILITEDGFTQLSTSPLELDWL